jgi:subtilisin family serine protease
MSEGNDMPGTDPSLGSVRLLVRLPALAHDASEVRARVDRQLGPVDSRGSAWRVEPLFGETDPADLRRWWTVSGGIPAVPAYDQSRVAYDLAAMLARDTDLDVEPDVPSTAFGHETVEVPAGQPVPESAGEGDTHLPAAMDRLWALDAVRARDAWQLEPAPGGRSRGEGVRIGHIDTGYSDHPELRGALDFSLDRDVLDDDDDARDPLRRRFLVPLETPGHGTHTGSVIAGRVAGEIAGVAPLATLVPIRAIRSVVQVFDSNVARAIAIARERGCHIVSMSLGGRGFIGLRDAIRAAVADGMIVMAAAGNKVSIVVAPASYPECIAVAATNADSRPWAGSSRGPLVDISAPGESVWAAAIDFDVSPPGFDRRQANGTSYAVATLAGVAALWLAHWGPEAVRQRYGPANVQRAFLSLLRSHGRRVPQGWVQNGWDRTFGVGIADTVTLLQAGLPPLPPAPEAQPAPGEAPVERLRSALGELTDDQVRSAVGRLLGIAPERVDDLSPVVVSELLYRLGEDDQLREGLLAQATPGVPETAPVADPRMLLARTSSLALRAALGS